jgi:lipoate-protein ligase B
VYSVVKKINMDTFRVYKLGIVPYQKALELQLSFLEKRRKGEIEDVLLLLEHPPTFTTGRRGKSEHLLLNQDELGKKGIHFEVVSRGGDITFHGPGQLVGYPILDLNKFNRDIHRYLRNLEEVVILALTDFKIKAERLKGITGVWVNADKIASIGVGVRRWTTYHGFALNVNTDLSYFAMIIPCGIQGGKITSIQNLSRTKNDINMSEVEKGIINAFSKVFNRKLSGIISPDRHVLVGAFDAEFLIGLERKLVNPSRLLA